MSEFFKVVTAKGKSFTSSENFTDPFVPALQSLQIPMEKVKFSGWRTMQFQPKSLDRPAMRKKETYQMSIVRHIITDEILMTVYKAETKETLIAIALYDKSTIKKLASVAKPSKRKRRV